MMANLINATANDLGLLLVELSIISFISLWIIKVIYPPVKKLPLYEIGRVIIAFFSVSMIWLSIEFAQNAWSGKAIATPILLILGIQIFLWSIGLMSVSSESLDDRIRKSLLTESVDTRKMLLLQRQRLSQSLQRGEILREYLAKMTTFLVNSKLEDGDSIAAIRAWTHAVMSELDSEHNAQICLFLSEAGLIQVFAKASLLKKAQLKGVRLSKAYLQEADLSLSYLEDADLEKAFLRNADLSHAVLVNANLEEADLQGANLEGAKFGGARYSQEDSKHGETKFPEGFDPEEYGMIRKS